MGPDAEEILDLETIGFSCICLASLFSDKYSNVGLSVLLAVSIADKTLPGILPPIATFVVLDPP